MNQHSWFRLKGFDPEEYLLLQVPKISRLRRLGQEEEWDSLDPLPSSPVSPSAHQANGPALARTRNSRTRAAENNLKATSCIDSLLISFSNRVAALIHKIGIHHFLTRNVGTDGTYPGFLTRLSRQKNW